MVHKGSTLKLGFNQGQCVDPDSSGGRLNSNLLRSVWLVVFKPGARLDYPAAVVLGLDLTLESRNAISVFRTDLKRCITINACVTINANPGCKDKSLMTGYLISFLQGGL